MENTRIIMNLAGDASVLEVQASAVPQPKSGEVCIKHSAIGVNFIDTYHRSGLYPVTYPSGVGLEAAGVVQSVGTDVSGVKIGDRVAYCSGPLGAYSQFHCVQAERLVQLPEDVGFDQVAATLLKGLTAAYLLFKTASLSKGDWILVHAAAGGVGQILCRWAHSLGVRVIGTVGSSEKIPTAKACGCEAVLLYREVDVAAQVKKLTCGRGVKVVYDGVGKDTFTTSLDSLQSRGLMVSYGNASGAVEDFSPLMLAAKGSLFLTRPTLGHYIADSKEFSELSLLFFDALKRGAITAAIDRVLPLADASIAHRLIESGSTQGALILRP